MAFDLDDEELEWTLKRLNKTPLHWTKKKEKESTKEQSKEESNETETKNK